MSPILRRYPTLTILLILGIGAVVLVMAHVKFSSPAAPSPTNRGTLFLPPQKTSARTSPVRNLALQPEALRLSRLLGKRFASENLEQSNLIGTLIIGNEQKSVQTTRSQISDGERVLITQAGTRTFTWDSKDGSRSSESRAIGSDRDLIERLVFDSPDQFVLAQLRGASYSTVARNVRAAESFEKGGALWNIVRVDDPQTDETKRPLSRWRLYYLNTATGLIDRIVSETGDQRLTATLTWTDLQGEKVPAQIIWTRDGQTVMRYQLSSFAHAQAEGGAK